METSPIKQTEIQKLSLQQGDVVIIKLGFKCDQCEFQFLDTRLKTIFPDNEVIVLDPHSEIKIICKDEKKDD